MNRTVHLDATTSTTVMSSTKTLSPFGLVAIAANSALRVAGVVPIMFALRLAQHQIFKSIIGANAVDVMHDFVPGERAPKVFFHHQPVNGDVASTNTSDKIPHSVQCALTSSPCWRVWTVCQSLFSELTRLRTRWCVGSELALWPRNRLSANCAGFSDVSHNAIVARLQEGQLT